MWVMCIFLPVSWLNAANFLPSSLPAWSRARWLLTAVPRSVFETHMGIAGQAGFCCEWWLYLLLRLKPCSSNLVLQHKTPTKTPVEDTVGRTRRLLTQQARAWQINEFEMGSRCTSMEKEWNEAVAPKFGVLCVQVVLEITGAMAPGHSWVWWYRYSWSASCQRSSSLNMRCPTRSCAKRSWMQPHVFLLMHGILANRGVYHSNAAMARTCFYNLLHSFLSLKEKDQTSILSAKTRAASLQRYPVCFTAITDMTKPHHLTICNVPVVFWHDGTAWRAAVDECPHRRVRLSEGRLEGSELLE